MDRAGETFPGRRVPRSGTTSPVKREASGSYTLLQKRTVTASRRRLPPRAWLLPLVAPPPATGSCRGPFDPRRQAPPAPVTATSITFMPRLPEHRPAGMERGRAAAAVGCVPVSPGAGRRLRLPDVNTERREEGKGPGGGGRHGNPGRKRKRGGRGRGCRRHLAGGAGAAGAARCLRAEPTARWGRWPRASQAEAFSAEEVQ